MERYERGRLEYRALIGSPPEEASADLRSRSPHLYDALVEGAFGGTLSDGRLSRSWRELATIAALIAMGDTECQLSHHVRAALSQGLASSELLALCEHLTLYAGFPRALNALAVVDREIVDAGGSRPPSMRRVRLADHETVVAQSGEVGPPIVLIHALGLDWRMWEPVMVQLAARRRRVFDYDVRGPFTMADAGADLVAVLDALGLERAHVVGLSYGGGIAQAAAVAASQRFESLALLATTDHPFAGAFEARARSAEQHGMAAQVVPSLTRWFTPEGLALGGWGVRYARESVLRGDPADWAAAWRAFKGIDVQGRLKDFPAPTLVLVGERDASTTPEIMSGLAGRIPRATYRQLPGVPHMQPLEHPNVVVEALDGFLPCGPRASPDSLPHGGR